MCIHALRCRCAYQRQHAASDSTLRTRGAKTKNARARRRTLAAGTEQSSPPARVEANTKVRVRAGFVSDDDARAEVAKGMIGRVVRTDSEGDALIKATRRRAGVCEPGAIDLTARRAHARLRPQIIIWDARRALRRVEAPGPGVPHDAVHDLRVAHGPWLERPGWA